MRKMIVIGLVLVAGIASASVFDTRAVDESGYTQSVRAYTLPDGKIVFGMLSPTITNTSYIVGVTRSATGAWIDCTGAKKVIFQFKLTADTDLAQAIDTGTYYIESSCQLASFLPTTVLPWNTNIGGVQTQTKNGYEFAVPDFCRSMRFRMDGLIRYTGSVSYTLKF